LGLTAASVTFILTRDPQLSFGDYKALWIGLSFFITTVTSYLIYDVLEANFAVQALSERIVVIEERINRLIASNVLVWESVVAARLWSPVWVPKVNIFHPVMLMLLYVAVALSGMIGANMWFYCWALTRPVTGPPDSHPAEHRYRLPDRVGGARDMGVAWRQSAPAQASPGDNRRCDA
jgi:hypothetical protein